MNESPFQNRWLAERDSSPCVVPGRENWGVQAEGRCVSLRLSAAEGLMFALAARHRGRDGS